jgi:WD40 repeat protein
MVENLSQVSYWEAYDGSLIRDVEASAHESVNSIDIAHDGQFFISGGCDKLVKVFRYEEGDVVATGAGHSTDITKVKISPDQKSIVSVSGEGAIFIWRFPFPVGPRLLPPSFAL